MRVISRLVWGALTIVFVLGFIASLVKRTKASPGAKVWANTLPTAAYGAGSAWGPVVAPPVSPSRVIGRKRSRRMLGKKSMWKLRRATRRNVGRRARRYRIEITQAERAALAITAATNRLSSGRIAILSSRR
jgi:hypothetical protein